MRFYITLLSITLLPFVCHAQNLITNGDFETDTFLVWPGYTGGGNPESISGWLRNEEISPGNVGINPVFEPQNPSSVVGWTRNEDSVSNIGINPVTDGRQPFADNGDVDGGILFLQGESSVFQEVTGLTVGEDYVLSVDYNARNCCGDFPAATLELNGEFSDQFPDPDDFIDALVEPVEFGAWWFTEIPITAESETLRIEFFTFPDFGGDATLLLDNINLERAHLVATIYSSTATLRPTWTNGSHGPDILAMKTPAHVLHSETMVITIRKSLFCRTVLPSIKKLAASRSVTNTY